MININSPEYWDSAPPLVLMEGRYILLQIEKEDTEEPILLRVNGYAWKVSGSGTSDRRSTLLAMKTFPIWRKTESYTSHPMDIRLWRSRSLFRQRANGKTSIVNLGQPMNSTGDDFAIFLFRPDRGFYTSNRDGGKGDDDIYTFVNEDPNLKVVNYYLQGITYTKDKDDKLQVLAIQRSPSWMTRAILCRTS
jgi:hypothetical protein